MQGIRRRGNRIDRGVTGLLGRGPRFLGGVPEPLLFLTECLERLAVPVARLPRFLRQYPELFGLFPGNLREHAMLFGGVARLLGAVTVFHPRGPGPSLSGPLLGRVLLSGFHSSILERGQCEPGNPFTTGCKRVTTRHAEAVYPLSLVDVVFMLRAWIDGPLTRPGKVAAQKRFVG